MYIEFYYMVMTVILKILVRYRLRFTAFFFTKFTIDYRVLPPLQSLSFPPFLCKGFLLGQDAAIF